MLKVIVGKYSVIVAHRPCLTSCSHYLLTQVQHGTARNKLQCKSNSINQAISNSAQHGKQSACMGWPRLGYNVNASSMANSG